MIALAHRIAGEGACAQARDIPRLRAAAIRLVNSRRVPAPLLDPLMSGVNALDELRPPCLPAVVVASPAPTAPPASVQPQRGHEHGHGAKRHGHKGHD